MKTTASVYSLGLVAAAVVTLTACGGGGGTTAPDASATTAITTTVMDGLIQNALVCADTNNNGLCDTTEPQGRTDANGKITLSIPTGLLSTTALIAVITAGQASDADTGLVNTTYTMMTPAGKHDVISPLTSMVQAKIDSDKANGTTTSVDAAEAYVKTQTGLTTISLFDDFIAKRATSAEHAKAGEIARVYVVSKQKSIRNPAACATTGSTESVREGHIESDLNEHLRDLRKVSDDAGKTCTSKSGILGKDCDDDIQNTAPTMTCTPTPTPTPTLIPIPIPTPPPAAQSITFNSPGNQTLGVTASTLAATASSGLTVTLASGTPAVCTVSGATLTLLAAGSCTITASQAGNTGYAAAASVARSFTVAAAPVVVVTSAANGKVLYASNAVMACGTCHGTPPSSQKVLNGANSPSTIASAISSGKGGMGMYAGKFTTQNLTDIAAYLAQPNL